MTKNQFIHRKIPQWLQVVLSIFVAGILIVILWKVPQIEIPHSIHDPAQRQSIENAARTTLATVVGGLAVFVTAFLTIKNIGISERNLGVGQNNLKVAEDNLKISEAKALTDRFSKAVEQLGSDKIAIRLGGVYSLERLAKDSPNDYSTILEVLCAFVREGCPKLTFYDVIAGGIDDFLAREISAASTDVQAAITAIGRVKRPNTIPVVNLDLSYVDLRGVVFAASPATYQHMDFKCTIFSAYGMRGAIFDHVSFSEIAIDGESISSVKFSHTAWTSITLKEHRFDSQCSFNDTRFTLCKINHVVFSGCSFNSIIFAATKFDSVTFEKCDFLATKYILSNWQDCELRNCQTVDIVEINPQK